MREIRYFEGCFEVEGEGIYVNVCQIYALMYLWCCKFTLSGNVSHGNEGRNRGQEAQKHKSTHHLRIYGMSMYLGVEIVHPYIYIYQY